MSSRVNLQWPHLFPALRIPQLRDGENHFDQKKKKVKGAMEFICEGPSATGSITGCRDVNNQAMFVLEGKLLEVGELNQTRHAGGGVNRQLTTTV